MLGFINVKVGDEDNDVTYQQMNYEIEIQGSGDVNLGDAKQGAEPGGSFSSIPWTMILIVGGVIVAGLLIWRVFFGKNET